MGPGARVGPTLPRLLPARAGAPPRPRPSVRPAWLAARGALSRRASGGVSAAAGPGRVPGCERAGALRRPHHVLLQAAQTHLQVLPPAAAPGKRPPLPGASGEPPQPLSAPRGCPGPRGLRRSAWKCAAAVLRPETRGVIGAGPRERPPGFMSPATVRTGTAHVTAPLAGTGGVVTCRSRDGSTWAQFSSFLGKLPSH